MKNYLSVSIFETCNIFWPVVLTSTDAASHLVFSHLLDLCFCVFPCTFKQCFKGRFCWFFYHPPLYIWYSHSFCSTCTQTYCYIFNRKKEKKYSNTRLRFCFWSARKYMVQMKHYWIQFCPRILKSTFLLHYEFYKIEFITKFRKLTTNCNKKAIMKVTVFML